MHGSGGPEFNHFWLDVTKTSKTSITSGFYTDVTLDVHFQGATLTQALGVAIVRHRRMSRPRTACRARREGERRRARLPGAWRRGHSRARSPPLPQVFERSRRVMRLVD